MSSGGGQDPHRPPGWWWRMSRSEQIVAAVVGAVIVGLFGIITPLIIGSSHTNPPGPASSAPAPGTANSLSSSSSAGQASGQTPGSPSASDWWHGQITIGQTGVELDARPATTNGSSYTFNEIAGYLHPGNGQIAEWKGSSAPTPAQCHDWVLSNSSQQIQLTSGMQLCVLTASNRTAYVEITGVSADGNSATASAIVWTT